MDRYDEVLAMLRQARGMSIERALRIKADDTILAQVGPHGDEFVALESLCRNEDGSPHTSSAEMQARIAEYFVQSVAPVRVWRARHQAAGSG